MNKNYTSVEKLYDKFNQFTCYKVVLNGVTSFVPNDTNNTDYHEVQAWSAIDGNNIIDPGA